MSKFNFPAVQAKSPSDALKMLGIDEGAILEYNPASGMYVVSDDSDDVAQDYTSFGKDMGFSKKVIEALIESGVVEELLTAEDEVAEGREEPDVEQWDKADLTMVCGRCKAEEKVTEAIGGATLFMPTTSQAETRLVCTECGNTMSLLYRNGAMMTDEEKVELEAKKKEQEAQRDKVTEVPEDMAKQPMTPDEAYEEDLVKEDIDYMEVSDQNYRDNLELEEDEPQEKSE